METRGRPALPAADKLVYLATIKARPGEARALAAAARRAGLPLATWIREVALDAVKRSRAR